MVGPKEKVGRVIDYIWNWDICVMNFFCNYPVFSLSKKKTINGHEKELDLINKMTTPFPEHSPSESNVLLIMWNVFRSADQSSLLDTYKCFMFLRLNELCHPNWMGCLMWLYSAFWMTMFVCKYPLDSIPKWLLAKVVWLE